MSSRSLGVLTAICQFAGLALGLATANAQNLLTDLGPGAAYGINNSGQIVLANGIWNNGTVTAFPTGFTGAAINSSGEVAGTQVSTGIIGSSAFYSNGTVTLIPANGDPSVAVNGAFGLNDNSVVVGQGCGLSGSPIYAFIYENGQVTELGTFPGSIGDPNFDSVAYGINGAGQVTGTALNDSGLNYSHDAFIYDMTSAKWADLGPGIGYAINASNEVTGRQDHIDISSGTLVSGHAFIYSNGTMTDLGALTGGATSNAYAINGTGQIVGASTVAGYSGTHAFFYNGAMQDMNTWVSATDPLQPVTLTDARGINDTRLIVVNGIDSQNVQHAYLLQGPWLDVAPGPLSFPSQAIGTVSAAQTVTLTNSGSTLMALGAITTSGDFSQTNTCGASLAASASCMVMVTFGPTGAGDRSGTLTAISAGVPITVPLTGIAPIQVTLSSSASATMTGVPVKLTWTLSPGTSCMATGGSAADGWTGTFKASGSQSVTESTAGTYPYGLSCTAGSQAKSTQTSVVVSWPALTVSLTASPTTITSGKSTTLTWTSANAKTCVASGGGTSDGWAGTTRATSGSTAITETVVVASPLTLTYTLTCSNSGTSQSTPASVKVVLNPPAMSGGGGGYGGGGALNPMFLLFLTGVAATRRLRQSNLRDTSHENSFATTRSTARVWSPTSR
jgi:probable HAF family extracellular repeat protein